MWTLINYKLLDLIVCRADVPLVYRPVTGRYKPGYYVTFLPTRVHMGFWMGAEM